MARAGRRALSRDDIAAFRALADHAAEVAEGGSRQWRKLKDLAIAARARSAVLCSDPGGHCDRLITLSVETAESVTPQALYPALADLARRVQERVIQFEAVRQMEARHG